MECFAEFLGIITVAIIVSMLVWIARGDFGRAKGGPGEEGRRKKLKVANIVVQIILYGVVIYILYVLWRTCQAAKW